jgi:predicted TIM-barrel fold metal-dependent hydrolase
MRNGFKVFDADAHVVYPADLWGRFLEPRFGQRVDRKQPAAGFETYNPVRVDGRYTQHPTILYGQFQKLINWTQEDMVAKYGDCMTHGFRGDLVAEAIARDGIDIAVIYGPEFDMWYSGIDPEMQAAMARAYNRWGAEMAETSGGRVLAAAPVPLNDVGRAVEEIQYAYEHLGARAFWTRPDEFNGRTLGDRYYDPIWELVQDLGVSFATHEYMGLVGNSFGQERYKSFVEWHSVVHTFEAMGAMMSMLVHGVFERFPRLRVSYMEAGCGWLPSWLHRIDEQLELASLEFPDLTMSATDYFRRNCWITTECEDRFVADVIRWFGDGHIIYESDFPHPDSKFPHSVETFLALAPEQISDDNKRKILWDNAVDFYRFPESMLPTSFVDVAQPAPA